MPRRWAGAVAALLAVRQITAPFGLMRLSKALVSLQTDTLIYHSDDL
jgi:hypothetical protein